MLSFNKSSKIDIPIAIVENSKKHGGDILYIRPDLDEREIRNMNIKEEEEDEYYEIEYNEYEDFEYDSYEEEDELEYYKPDARFIKIGKKETKKGGKKFISLYEGGFVPIPNPNKDSTVYYLCAPRGAGKTTLSIKIATVWQELNPDKNIYLFSETSESKKNAEIYSKLNNLNIVNVNESLITNPIKLDELKNSLCLFDDYNTMPRVSVNIAAKGEKPKYKMMSLTKAVEDIRDQVLQNGRHYNISIIIAGHMMFNYRSTRIILEELDYLIFYRDTGRRHVNKYITETLGLDKVTAKKITTLKSRWTLISKTSPSYVLTEFDAMVI